ncbi:MAG: hypothetical protein WBZ29_13340, partial [Methanocella sp.]
EGLNIRWEVAVGLLAIIMIAFIVFSGLWNLSSWDSMRGYTWGVYSKTDDWAGVNEQYKDMQAAFDNGQYSYTYQIANISCAINQNMVKGTAKPDYINAVLDVYTSALFTSSSLPGIRGGINWVAGTRTHDLYGAIAIITAILGFVLLRYIYVRSKLTDFLKQVGASFIGAGVITLVMLIAVFTMLVEPWVKTNEIIYKEGLPIIAQMIKEFYQVYIIAIIILGVIMVAPAIIQLLTKGKEEKENKPAAPK